jgi:hypothetical protein
MGRYIRLLGGVAISCAVLSGCSNTATVPTGPSAPYAAPQPVPSPPGGFTLSGVVSEVINGQSVPIEGVHVEDSRFHQFVNTGPDGSYRITDVGVDPYIGATIYFAKTGFRSQTRRFVPSGDTRLDISLIRE